MIFDSIAGIFSSDLAIDLGTANTLVYVRGKGLICSEPSVVAVAKDSNGRDEKVLAVGHEAKEMLGRTPGGIRAIRPIKDGVIADFEITEAMLRYFIQRAHNRRKLVRPRIVICVPPCITSVEKRAVRESALSAGAREVGEQLVVGVDQTVPAKGVAIERQRTDVAALSGQQVTQQWCELRIIVVEMLPLAVRSVERRVDLAPRQHRVSAGMDRLGHRDTEILLLRTADDDVRPREPGVVLGAIGHETGV